MKRLVVVEIEVNFESPAVCHKDCSWLRPEVGCTLFESLLKRAPSWPEPGYWRAEECLAAQIKPGDQVE